MLGLLANMGKNILSSFLPSAVNWGVNKLMTTNFGKQYINRPLMNRIGGVVDMVKANIPEKPQL